MFKAPFINCPRALYWIGGWLLCGMAGYSLADTNIDPAAEHKRMRVERLVISSAAGATAGELDGGDLLALANEKRQAYGEEMTFTELSRVADHLTDALRAQGYKFHYAYLPPQRSRSGVVRLNVVEVQLDSVIVLGDPGISPTILAAPFKALLGRPLFQPEVDKRLRTLNRQPESQIFAYYSRGSRPNSVRLNLRTTANSHHQIHTTLDNAGSESSGHYRWTTQYSLLSPLGHFDRLDISAMAAAGGAQNLYGYIAYQHPLTGPDNGVAFRATNNRFDVGQAFAALELQGDTLIAGLEFFQQWLPSDHHSHRLTLSGYQKSVDYSNIFNDNSLIDDETADVFGAQWAWQYQGTSFTQLTQLSGFTGTHSLTGASNLQSDFQVLQFMSASRWFWRAHQVRLQIDMQLADSLLPSFEKLPLTGLQGARGYYAGQFSADRGGRAQLQWRYALPWLTAQWQWLPQVFVDHAQGDQLSAAGDTLQDLTATSVGIGLSGQHPHWQMQLQWSAWNDAQRSVAAPLRTLPISFELHYRW